MICSTGATARGRVGMRVMWSLAVLFAAATGCDSCPGNGGDPDAGPGDAGPGDAGPIDAGPVDAGPGDAGPVDAQQPDSGPPPRDVAAPITRNVVVIEYNPVDPGNPAQRLRDVHGWPPPLDHAARLESALRTVSGGVVDFQIVDQYELDEFPLKEDGFRYDWNSYMACRANVAQCHMPDAITYAPVLAEDTGIDLCARIAAGEIDEIWLWGPGYFGFDEFAYKVPGDAPMFDATPDNPWLYDLRRKDLPECGRTYFVMGYNTERQEGEGLHSFGHRMESALALSPVGRGLWHRCGTVDHGSSDWTDFLCIEQDGAGRAGCGDVHYPPNAVTDYDYSNTSVVDSTCDDWLRYPDLTGATTSVSAATWLQGGTRTAEDDYLRWWMSHIPRYVGGADILYNWWEYVLCYDSPCNFDPACPMITAPVPPAPPACDDLGANGTRQYQLCSTASDWESALGACRSLGEGWDLVGVGSLDEQTWLVDALAAQGQGRTWLGLHDRITQGTYVWTTCDDTADFVYWDTHEPNMWPGEDCVELDRNRMGTDGQPGHWNDLSCDVPLPFVCEGPVP